MPAQRRHAAVKTRVGDPQHAHLAVVILQVLDQPVYSIIGITGLVNIVLAFFIRIIGPYVYKAALAHPAPPYILYYKDITFLHILQPLGTPERAVLSSVGRTAVGRAAHQYRMCFRIVLRQVNGGE